MHEIYAVGYIQSCNFYVVLCSLICDSVILFSFYLSSWFLIPFANVLRKVSVIHSFCRGYCDRVGLTSIRLWYRFIHSVSLIHSWLFFFLCWIFLFSVFSPLLHIRYFIFYHYLLCICSLLCFSFHFHHSSIIYSFFFSICSPILGFPFCTPCYL